jgi:hypothetical protein
LWQVWEGGAGIGLGYLLDWAEDNSQNSSS